jgi:flagellar hook-basal body complex protein FliE
MVEKINPIGSEIKLAQLLGDDYLAQAPETSPVNPEAQPLKLKSNIFEDALSKAIDSLNGISRAEIHANELIDKYSRGEVELHEVMLAQSKLSIMVQLAVTTINSAVTTFKEVTQMQI